MLRLVLPFELFPKQQAAVDTLATFARASCWSAVGTGKTAMSTATIQRWQPRKTLIVLPPVLLPQWKEWLAQCGETASVFYGPKRNQSMLQSSLILTSHACFRDSIDLIEQHYDSAQDCILLDEAQAIKSPKSKLFKYIKKLAGRGHLLLLSGTPTNTPADAYAPISLKTPAIYRSHGHFENMHVEDRDFFGQVTKWKNLELLEHNLHLNSVSVTREDLALDGKAEVYRTHYYDLSPAHQRLYETIVDEQLVELENEVIDATTAQRLHHALQQVIMMPQNFSDDKTLRGAGFDVIDNALDELGARQLIIWLHYVRSVEGVGAYLQEKGIKVALAYGKSDVDKALQNFKEQKAQILVANAASIGVGVNLQFCQDALFLEYNASAISSRQAAGRINRIGQKSATLTTWACANKTLQVKRLRDLLNNDSVAAKLERTKSSLRAALLGN